MNVSRVRTRREGETCGWVVCNNGSCCLDVCHCRTNQCCYWPLEDTRYTMGTSVPPPNVHRYTKLFSFRRLAENHHDAKISDLSFLGGIKAPVLRRCCVIRSVNLTDRLVVDPPGGGSSSGIPCCHDWRIHSRPVSCVV